MLYWIAEYLGFPGVLNLLRYQSTRTGGAVATALAIGLIIGPKFIGWLRVRQGKGQPIRSDGPQTHFAKVGTPTMGGLMILTAMILSILLWMDLTNPYVWACLFVTLGFGTIGFLDDYDKVRKASTAGVSGRVRLLGEFVIAGAAAWLITQNNGTMLYVPFFSNFAVDLGPAYIVFAAFTIVAFGNAVNLTDGLDGLAIMPVIIACVAFMVITYLAGNAKYAVYLGIPHVPGAGELAILTGAVVGAGLAFLWFNAPPAAVFMGDTGSLALGGVLGAIAVTAHHEIVLGIIGGLFVVEAMSVIIQVFFYKRTGKRVFKMAPIHHHFEQLGWSEPTVVIRFWIISLVLALAGLSTLKIRVIVSRAWAGKRYAVLGLARSGAATVRALVAGGAKVVGWDSNSSTSQPLLEGLKSDREQLGTEPGFEFKNWELALDLAGYEAIVVSPGVPLNRHPVAQRAERYGLPIIGDIELFAQARADLPAHRVVGITGTNGKSTTTALIAHICETAGLPARLGGNIGLPILGQEPLPEGGVYVLELSSYQIDLTQTLDCDVVVLLNITPDHLDRYAGFDAYAASKARLFAMQSKGHAAIIGLGDDPSAAIAKQLARSGRAEDVTRIAPGVCMDQSRWPALQGPHNAQNALAAIAACEALGIGNAAIDAGLARFPGLPHRMERVATRNGVAFVNDSKATNPTSTAPALAAFDRIHWILGGQAKTDDLDACRPGFAHVARAYTIGEAGAMFAKLLAPDMPVQESGTLDRAVRDAAGHAQPGDTVLLSPACASFDQFRDYEDRGAKFREAVEALA